MNADSASRIDQLVIATVSSGQADDLVCRLTGRGFHVTRVDSQRGWLEESTVSLVIGLDKTRLPELLAHIREYCRPRRHFIPAQVEAPLMQFQPMMIEAETGGATVYALDVERFEQL